jgi:hypothetical protein
VQRDRPRRGWQGREMGTVSFALRVWRVRWTEERSRDQDRTFFSGSLPLPLSAAALSNPETYAPLLASVHRKEGKENRQKSLSLERKRRAERKQRRTCRSLLLLLGLEPCTSRSGHDLISVLDHVLSLSDLHVGGSKLQQKKQPSSQIWLLAT